jgi:hypothetical protein
VRSRSPAEERRDLEQLPLRVDLPHAVAVVFAILLRRLADAAGDRNEADRNALDDSLIDEDSTNSGKYAPSKPSGR